MSNSPAIQDHTFDHAVVPQFEGGEGVGDDDDATNRYSDAEAQQLLDELDDEVENTVQHEESSVQDEAENVQFEESFGQDEDSSVHDENVDDLSDFESVLDDSNSVVEDDLEEDTAVGSGRTVRVRLPKKKLTYNELGEPTIEEIDVGVRHVQLDADRRYSETLKDAAAINLQAKPFVPLKQNTTHSSYVAAGQDTTYTNTTPYVAAGQDTRYTNTTQYVAAGQDMTYTNTPYITAQNITNGRLYYPVAASTQNPVYHAHVSTIPEGFPAYLGTRSAAAGPTHVGAHTENRQYYEPQYYYVHRHDTTDQASGRVIQFSFYPPIK